MNENTIRLWKEVLDYCQDLEVSSMVPPVFVERFTKLVANECISQLIKVSDRHTDQYIDAALRDAAFEIEKQFGLD